jgi:hypothetical protein
MRTGIARGENHFLRAAALIVQYHGAHQALAQANRGFEGFGQALFLSALHHDTVHHRLDGVLEVLLEFRRFVQRNHRAVDARADVTLGAQPVEDVHVLALACSTKARNSMSFEPTGSSMT